MKKYTLVLAFVLTAVIQSSSAAMVITLSALESGIITLPAGAAVVIGVLPQIRVDLSTGQDRGKGDKSIQSAFVG